MDRYYEEELRYLTEAGHEFALKHPERAGFLRLESQDRDPYVERLLEGFAFLAGRVRERLEDDFPEFTQGLLELLFPHYLRPVPAMAWLQFTPRRAALQQTQVIPRGTVVLSSPVGPEGVACRFTTSTDVPLNPATLEEARLERTPRGRHVLRLRLVFDRGVEPRALVLDPLVIALHGEPTLTSTLHQYLTRHVQHVRFRGVAESPREVPGPDRDAVQPAGFGEREALLPYTLRSFPGYRHLQEYFSFRERFLAVEVRGFSRLEMAEKTTAVEAEFHFDRDFPEEKRFSAENFRLHVTPIVNLFTADAEPITATSQQAEHNVIADANHPASVEVYGVESVTGLGEGRARAYLPFYGVREAIDREEEIAGTFVVRQRLGPTGRWHTRLRISRFAGVNVPAGGEALSIRTTCTNGPWPRDLGEGQIATPGPGFPAYAQIVNLTRPTAPLYPPSGQDLEWRLIAHLALNQHSLRTPEAVRGLLELYDWSQSPAHRRRIAGVRAVQMAPEQRVFRGTPVRGTRIGIELAEDHFVDRADAHHFGLMLARFLRLYASVNSFVHVIVDVQPSGDHYEWPPTPGQTALL